MEAIVIKIAMASTGNLRYSIGNYKLRELLVLYSDIRSVILPQQSIPSIEEKVINISPERLRTGTNLTYTAVIKHARTGPTGTISTPVIVFAKPVNFPIFRDSFHGQTEALQFFDENTE